MPVNFIIAKLKVRLYMSAIKTEYASSKFQAFSSYSLICGENCVLCRLSATVYFLSGMIVLLMGNSLSFIAVLSFNFLCSNFLFIRKFGYFWYFLYKQKVHNKNKVRTLNINLSLPISIINVDIFLTLVYNVNTKK